MRRALFVSVFGLIAAGVFAFPGGTGPGLDARALNAEIAAILDQSGQSQLGTMTVAELQRIAGQISIAIQKEEYVRRAGAASMMLPGLGQFRTGDSLNGSLFLAGDIVLFAGTLVGAYFLLPSNVQFASMDYLNTPLSSIRSTWESNTIIDYAPAIGVAAAGMAAQMLLRWISSRNAREDARQAVESGKVTFEPELVPLFDPLGRGGMPGVGMRLRWR